MHARADGAHTLTWTLYRMGFYGGAEARGVASGGPVPVGVQPTAAAAPGTGLVACGWPVTFSVPTDPGRTSGVHLLLLTRDDGPQTYASFVLRDDGRKGAAVFQASFMTYQAYNAWGGRSSYSGFAPELSSDRPFAEGNGAGQYFLFEHDLVRWLEAGGYDVTYVTDLDVDRDGGLLAAQRILSVGHDEYWTRAAREHVEAALAAGVNVAAARRSATRRSRIRTAARHPARDRAVPRPAARLAGERARGRHVRGLDGSRRPGGAVGGAGAEVPAGLTRALGPRGGQGAGWRPWRRTSQPGRAFIALRGHRRGPDGPPARTLPTGSGTVRPREIPLVIVARAA